MPGRGVGQGKHAGDHVPALAQLKAVPPLPALPAAGGYLAPDLAGLLQQLLQLQQDGGGGLAQPHGPGDNKLIRLIPIDGKGQGPDGGQYRSVLI